MSARAQCVVLRGDKLLMARHQHECQTWWCLPGGAIETSEAPEEAALRELEEECGVSGRILRKVGYVAYAEANSYHTFLIDIGDQGPSLGVDPDSPPRGEQKLAEIRWMSLWDIPERDRAFLWASGLLGVELLLAIVEGWGDELSYPEARAGES